MTGLFPSHRAFRPEPDPPETGSSHMDPDLPSVRFDLEKLYLITEALWNVLKHQHGYTDEHLNEMVRRLDERDGKLDGRYTPSGPPAECSACGRTLIVRQARCLYCGHAADQPPFLH